MRAAPLSFLIALSACATHRESAVQLDESAQQDTQSHAAESVEIHRIEEPSRVTTTTEEYGPLQEEVSEDAAAPLVLVQREVGEGRDQGTQAERAAADAAEAAPVVLPFHGKLVRRIVRVEERGQVSETTSAKGSSEATAAATATLAAKADSERDSKPSLGLPYLGLLLAGIAAAAIFTRGVWLGPLVNFIRGKL